MKDQVSPVERAQQILRTIELEERRKNSNNNTKNRRSMSPPPPSDDEVSGEGVSMEGPAKRTIESEIPMQAVSTQPIIRLDPENIVQGFIFSEILGKPVSRRRGRW